MNPSYNNLPSQGQSPIISSGDIVLPSSTPKKSKKPLVIILIIVAILAIVAVALVVLNSTQNKKSIAKTAFSNFSAQLNSETQDISSLKAQYDTYYKNITASNITDDDKTAIDDYDEVWDFYYLYKTSGEISRAVIAQKYLSDGEAKTKEYFNNILAKFETENYYSKLYFEINAQFLDIMIRYYKSYENAGCLTTFIEQSYCADVAAINPLITDEEYVSIITLADQSENLVKTNYADLISGTEDINNIFGVENE